MKNSAKQQKQEPSRLTIDATEAASVKAGGLVDDIVGFIHECGERLKKAAFGSEEDRVK
jgi:hypothetical protein